MTKTRRAGFSKKRRRGGRKTVKRRAGRRRAGRRRSRGNKRGGGRRFWPDCRNHSPWDGPLGLFCGTALKLS